MNTVVHIFKDTSMSYQHDGLRRVAAANRVKLELLKTGEHAIFLNSRCDKIKMYSYNGVLSYWRHPEGSKLNLHMIEQIPRCFSEKEGMDWGKAEKLALDALLSGTSKRTKAPAQGRLLKAGK